MLDFKKVEQLLEREGAKWIADIQANMIAEGANASGNTSASLETRATRTPDGLNFQVIGDEAFNWIETGRGPTRGSGNGDVLPRIRKWIDDKGLVDDEGDLDALAYKIANTIHNYGTLLYRLGERRDIYTPVFSDSEIDRVTKLIEDLSADEIESTFIKAWSK